MTTAKVFQIRPEFLPLSLARALWKGKILAGLLWIAASAITALVVMRLPSVYYSDALVVVDSPKIPERFISSIVTNDFQDRLARITQQIQSSTRLKEIIDEVKLFPNQRSTAVPEDLVQAMRQKIRLSMEGGRGRRAAAFRIGFEGESPAVVAQVANRLANLYIEENLRVRESQAEGTTEFVDAQLQESKKRLDELEAAISRYKQQHNGELPQQETALAGAMARQQTDLRINADALERARDARQLLESTLSMAEGQVATLSRRAEPVAAAGGAAATTATEPDPAAAQPAPRPARLSDAIEAELRALRTRYTAQHPEVRRLQQKLTAVQASEAEAPAPPAPPPPARAPRRVVATAPARPAPEESAELVRARERTAALQAQIRRTEKEIADRESEVARLQRESAVLQQRLQQMPIREQEIAQITRDYQITKGNYEGLMAKKLSAEMSTDLERRQKAERFTILEPARTPSLPSRPNRLALNLAGSAFGLLLGIVAVLARELKRDVFLGEWELADRYPVLGRLPRIEMPAAPEGRA